MRILVTGHEGYIGTILTRQLLDQGYEVVGLDTGYFASDVLGPGCEPIPTIRKDIRDVGAADLEGFQVVMHLAGLSNDPLGNLRPDLTHEINCQATIRLGRLAKQSGVERLLFSSSCSVYGAASPDDVLDEYAPFHPVTPYGRSKVQAEEGLCGLAGDGFSPVFLRHATAYGFSPRLRFDLVLNDLAASAFVTGRIVLKSDGTPWRPLVHVDDIAGAFLAVLQAPREVVHSQAFNVGRDEDNHQIMDLARMVQQIVPGSSIEMLPGAGPDLRCYRVDFGKIRRELPAFQPQWTVSRGLQQLLQAYRDWGLAASDWDGPRFQRIRRMQQWLQDGHLDDSLRWMVRPDRPPRRCCV